MALNKAPDPPLLGSPITDRGGLLIQSGQQLLDRIWRQVAAGHVVIPCEAVTASNVITLTPKLHPNGAEDLGDHMTFAFTADATSTGSVTAIVGAIPEIKVYVNGGADQAGTGDVVSDKTYFGTYVAALDSGNGGLVLVGEQNASGIVGVSGTDTPTLTNSTNLDASTAFPQHYTLIDDVVTMSGLFQADATAAAGTTTVMGMSLPVSTTFGGVHQLAGAGVSVSGSVQTVVRFLADTTNHRATATWLSQSTANLSFVFTFQYRVI